MGVMSICRAAATAGLAVSIGLLPVVANAQIVVKGVLYDDATGAVLRGAVMLVDPRTDAAVVHTSTDSLGNFSLQAPAGTYQIAAVLGGYTSVLSAPIPLASGERMTVRIPIAQSGDPTHRIGVTEHVRPDPNAVKADEYRLRDGAARGVAMRRAAGTGLHFDRTQLMTAGVQTLGEFLQSVPGFSVQNPGSASSMSMNRNVDLMSGAMSSPTAACHLGWFIDGRRADMPGQTDPLTDALGSMSLDGLDAIEVFRGVSEMAAEFSALDLHCGAVSLWTHKV